MPPSVSRSGRPIELLPSGPISLIGNSAPSLAALIHRGVCFKKITTRRTKTSPSVAAKTLGQAFKLNSWPLQFIPTLFLHLHNFSGHIGWHGNLIANFYYFNQNPSILCYTCIYKTSIVVTAHWQIGKDQKYQNDC